MTKAQKIRLIRGIRGRMFKAKQTGSIAMMLPSIDSVAAKHGFSIGDVAWFRLELNLRGYKEMYPTFICNDGKLLVDIYRSYCIKLLGEIQKDITKGVIK